MADRTAPAFYARQGTVWSDWWTLLHPPYTVWHLSYVVLGAALVPHRDWTALFFSVLAFFLAVGLAAHALDEWYSRPLGTSISAGALRGTAVVSLAGAVAIGVVGAFFWDGVNWGLVVAIPVGVALVLGYNLELFDGLLHTDHGFAWAWGGFPVVVGFLGQAPRPSVGLLLGLCAATLAGVGTSYAQRVLSTPARRLRRQTLAVSGTLTRSDGVSVELDRRTLLAPLEGALRALSWAVPLVAVAVLLAGT